MSIENFVTSRASSVVVEDLKVTLGPPSLSSLTPSTITAMVGIANNSALQLAPSVQTAMGKLSFSNISNVSLWPAANAALASLSTLQSSMGFGSSPNHGAFGSILSQAKNHISDSVDLKKATNFISQTSFADLGSGITNFSSMATQGLDGALGSLTDAAAAMQAAGPCFDTSDMATFGSDAGFVNKLSSVKLGNATGVNELLTANGVDLDDISDPVYADTVKKTLSKVTDPATITTIKDQLGLPASVNISNLSEFTNLDKLVDPAQVSELTGGLLGLSTKFKDLGGSFPNPAAASDMLNNISIPSVPSLDAVPSMSDLMSGMETQLDDLTGTGTGELGMPSMNDFLEGVAGGPSFDALNGAVTEETIAGISASVSQSSSLFAKAGVNVTGLATTFDGPGVTLNSLGAAKNFATSLHKYGQDSEISGLLSGMATPGNQFGDSIKASLAEGKNKALMAVNGIKPLDFKG